MVVNLSGKTNEEKRRQMQSSRELAGGRRAAGGCYVSPGMKGGRALLFCFLQTPAL